MEVFRGIYPTSTVCSLGELGRFAVLRADCAFARARKRNPKVQRWQLLAEDHPNARQFADYIWKQITEPLVDGGNHKAWFCVLDRSQDYVREAITLLGFKPVFSYEGNGGGPVEVWFYTLTDEQREELCADPDDYDECADDPENEE